MPHKTIMTVEYIRMRIELLKEMTGDCAKHEEEDSLRHEFIVFITEHPFVPNLRAIAQEVLKTTELPFVRWYE